MSCCARGHSRGRQWRCQSCLRRCRPTGRPDDARERVVEEVIKLHEVFYSQMSRGYHLLPRVEKSKLNQMMTEQSSPICEAHARGLLGKRVTLHRGSADDARPRSPPISPIFHFVFNISPCSPKNSGICSWPAAPSSREPISFPGASHHGYRSPGPSQSH